MTVQRRRKKGLNISVQELKSWFITLSKTLGELPIFGWACLKRKWSLICTVLHYTAVHCSAPYCTALHCTALHCTIYKYFSIIKCYYSNYTFGQLLQSSILHQIIHWHYYSDSNCSRVVKCELRKFCRY